MAALDRPLYQPRFLVFSIGIAVFSASVYTGWLIGGWGGGIVAWFGLAAVLVASTVTRFAERLISPHARVSAPVGEAGMSMITDEVGIGYAAVGRDGRIVSANHALAKLLGVPRASGPLIGLFAAHERAAIETAMAELLAGERTLKDLRIELIGRPGEMMLITLGFSPRLERIFMLAKDDSLQLRLEAQMRQATKMQAVGQLAGGLAHDFNNILTAIIGHCDLMLMRHGKGDVDYYDVDQIRQNANRAANLVRQLLAFSRQQTLRMRVVQIADVVGELSHLLRRLLGEQVRLTVTQASTLAPVRVDPGQIEQVLVNLAVNARDAMPDGGALTIATTMVAAADVTRLGHRIMPITDYVAVSVTDTGTGIPSEIIGNVFDPFFTTKDVGKGTGLGLAMAYGIVKQSGGFIFVDSSPGRGTRFDIYFAAAASDAVVEARADPSPPLLEAWGKGTILLVEDEAMVRAVAARALTRSGYDVLTASCGEDALAIVKARPDIDLLISDVVMLGMDGPALVERARAARPDLRTLFISGYADEQIRSRVDDLATPLLRKPFSVQELSAAVRARLAA